ncbi:Ig-like domain repeat protein [Phytohabitans suffuscus]|uniref:Ig-like domain repeat protein n=1 Tax=Phytohabitans suffuscus TaxID=624315 RepID=UPI0015D283DE|nr:Ig-like domain repeat protein [Phytohabitans suffuscus]
MIGTDQVTANGTASVAWTGLAPATSYAWVVSAKSADGGEAVAQPAVFRTARGVPVVTATSTPVAWGTAARVTVTVDAAPAPVTGTVELREGTTVRGSAALSGGTATFTLPVGLAGGTHTLTAAYSGSEHLDPARATVTVTVDLPAAWSASTVYGSGDRVTYQGRVFTASWYSKNNKPGDPYGPWQELAMTEAGVAIWTPSRVFDGGDVAEHEGKRWRARWYTRNQRPGDPYGPWERVG